MNTIVAGDVAQDSSEDDVSDIDPEWIAKVPRIMESLLRYDAFREQLPEHDGWVRLSVALHRMQRYALPDITPTDVMYTVQIKEVKSIFEWQQAPTVRTLRQRPQSLAPR